MALANALLQMKRPVDELYAKGVVAPIQDAASAKSPTATRPAAGPTTRTPDGALSGAPDDLVAMSACEPREFARALAGSDEATLGGLAGKLLVFKAMVVEVPRPAEGRLLGALLISRRVAAEFPARSAASDLKMGNSLVVAGECRMTGSGWALRVLEWASVADLNAGKAMRLCDWSRPVPPAQAVPVPQRKSR